ncbi:MAG: hypothetical protein ACREMT_03050 [Vulcanimicrobiaceae bacterium]
MRKMLGGINEERHYDTKSYAEEIAQAEKHLASDYDSKHMTPPPLKGISANTKAFQFDIGQILYALRTVKVGPWEVCAGWLVTTRGVEQPPTFYVGPCKKNDAVSDPRDRPRPGFPTAPPLHN